MKNDQLSFEETLKQSNPSEPKPNLEGANSPSKSADSILTNEKNTKAKISDQNLVKVKKKRKKAEPAFSSFTKAITKNDINRKDTAEEDTAKKNTNKLTAKKDVLKSSLKSSLAPPLATPIIEPEEVPVYSISDINKFIRNTLETKFSFIWLKGEISNFKAHTSGHFYFSLKDEKAQISAVMFKGYNQKLKFVPENGMEVLVKGKITVYEPRGNYQVFCETLEPVGAGALQKAFEQLKNKLSLEGLFDKKHKKPIPSFPKHIAVITSPTGAAIQDILNVLKRRSKNANITVIPARVQGPTAVNDLLKAFSNLKLLNQSNNETQNNKVDVIILGRGGGSIEDLWCFNDEKLARTIFDCDIPIISAVGHEIDFTISDFVSDLRAPTPSAAAELVVADSSEVINGIIQLSQRLKNAFNNVIFKKSQSVKSMDTRLIDPKRKLQDLMIKNDDLVRRLLNYQNQNIKQSFKTLNILKDNLKGPQKKILNESNKIKFNTDKLQIFIENFLSHKKKSLNYNMNLLDSVSPLRVLDRGYTLIKKQDGIIHSLKSLKENDDINIQFKDGDATATIKKINISKKN